jgi:uncharacterized membrane protein YfcA
MTYLLLLMVGLFAGIASGMFGIGGGLIIVPGLVFLMKMKDLEAIGTSLAALVPPAGLLGAIEYYRNGYVNIRYALVIAACLLIGAYFGARIMISLPPAAIKRMYALLMIVIASKWLLTGK